MKTIIAIICLHLCTITLVAQRCYTDQHFQDQYTPQEQKKILHQLHHFTTKKNFVALPIDTLLIAVAVHFQDSTLNESDRPCLTEAVHQQLAITNNDLQGNGYNIALFQNQQDKYNGVQIGRSKIRLKIAKFGHPISSGIPEGQPAITINQTQGDTLPDWAGYLNIIVRKADVQYLGYSPLGGKGNGDGVVIINHAFGNYPCKEVGTNPIYNFGRTLTHELGHYFLLEHIWGLGPGGCFIDDGLSDTPLQARPTYNCPMTKESCGSLDLFLSFMDYTDDDCMVLFTQQQAQRMDNWAAQMTILLENAADKLGEATNNDPIIIDTIVPNPNPIDPPTEEEEEEEDGEEENTENNGSNGWIVFVTIGTALLIALVVSLTQRREKALKALINEQQQVIKDLIDFTNRPIEEQRAIIEKAKKQLRIKD